MSEEKDHHHQKEAVSRVLNQRENQTLFLGTSHVLDGLQNTDVVGLT